MANSFVWGIIQVIVFFGIWTFFVFIIIKSVQNLGKDIFTFDFKETLKYIKGKNFNRKPIHRFSAGVTSFNFPKMSGIILPPGVSVRGFYVRVFVFEECLLIKFFNKAILIDNPERIKLSKQFIGGMMSVENNQHSVQIVLFGSKYKKIQDWVNRISYN